MLMSILKIVSLLSEHRDPFISDQEYNDIIHGRSGLENLAFQGESVPIEPETTPWVFIDNEGDDRLERTYAFSNFKTLHYFVNEALKHQNKVNHHGVITIEESSVKVVLQTKDVLDVTELDKDLSEYLDHIYKDTQYFYPITSQDDGR